MKKVIFVIILVITTATVFSVEQKAEINQQRVYTTMLSPGWLTTIGLGTGKIDPDGKTEKLTVLHGGVGPLIAGGGLYFHNSYFKDSTRTGIFYTFNCGADIIFTCVGDPGGGIGCSTYFLPIIAGGIGYSTQIGNNSCFRVSLDLGIKAILSNLNLSITF